LPMPACQRTWQTAHCHLSLINYDLANSHRNLMNFGGFFPSLYLI
jgi:hypothetical protein